MKMSLRFAALCSAALLVAPSWALTNDGLKEGAVSLQSAGPITFGPDGILFIADTKAAAIVAVDTQDTKTGSAKDLKVEGLDQKVAALLGTSADQILITDMAVNPLSHQVYLAVSRGRGPEAKAAIVRVTTNGKLEAVSLDKLRHSRAELPDAPVDGVVGQPNRQSNPRLESITDIAFFEDRLLVAGLSNEEFASTFRAIPFPFKTVGKGTSVEIYHGSHGRFETRSPIRTFVPMKVGNEPQLLAAYTCTPLVEFPVKQITAGAKIMGKTVAELGNRNRPLDMIVYKKDGKDYLLLANSSRGIMKISTDNIENTEKIEAPVSDKKGLPYETINQWTGVEQLDRFDDDHALVLRKTSSGLSLEELPLP